MRMPHLPLHTVLFPHLPLPIHCFEPGHRALARDVLDDGSAFAGRFAISMIRSPGGDEGPGFETIGTICEVHSAEQFPDGRWLMLVTGVGRGRIGEVESSGPYRTARVEPIDEPEGTDAAALVPQAQRALDAYLASVKRFVVRTASVGGHADEQSGMTAALDDILKPVRLPPEPVAASYAVAGVVQVELVRKQRLLELPDAAARLRAEIGLLRRESALLGDGEHPTAPNASLGYHPN